MPNKYVVDTHAIIWFSTGDSRLGPNAERILSNPNSELILPITVLAEVCWIIERGRTSIPSATDFLLTIDADPRVTVIPLDRTILDKTLMLTDINEMHDRQITATALVLIDQGESVSLLTYDENIRETNLVPVIW
ncbi:twitching motility protein PilT [Candidatus Poribacteria bacterium]|nr:MAG: twitching motility protein PilT [Candidatus Poribacteria bacterium]